MGHFGRFWPKLGKMGKMIGVILLPLVMSFFGFPQKQNSMGIQKFKGAVLEAKISEKKPFSPLRGIVTTIPIAVP